MPYLLVVFYSKGYTYYYSMSSVATKSVLHVGNGMKLIKLVLLYSHIPIYGRLLARYRVDKIMTPPSFPIGIIWAGSQEQTHLMWGRSSYPGYAGLASPAWQKRPRQPNSGLKATESTPVNHYNMRQSEYGTSGN